MDSMTIRIYEASDEGYMYDIYDHDHTECGTQECESADGGQCTTTMANALEMVYGQAQDLVRRNGR